MDSRTITLYFPEEFEGGDLADGSVTTVKIADLAVTGEKVATSAIGSAHLIDALITTAKLANLSVSTEKLIDLTITAGKLASNSVETLKIVDDAITGIKIANAAIDTDKLSALSVTAAKLAGGVTDDIAQGITDAAAAQADATAAQADATSALSDLDDIAGDSKITPVEKLAVKLLWNAIASEKPDIDTQADTYSVSKVAYGTAYTTLDEYLNTTLTVFSNMAATTDIVRADWDTNFGVYYNAKVEILNAIAGATALLADWSSITGAQKPADGADVTSYTDTRVANALEENSVLTISRPVGSSYSGGASDTGVIKIQLPQSWTDTMIRFTIDFYLFADYISFSLMIGGYNRSTNSTWISKTVSLFGSIAANNRVRFAHDGTYCCILIGETNTSWSYPKVSVRDFQAANANKELDKWNDGWVISVVSDLTSYAISGDISDALIDASAIKDQGNLAVLDAVDSAQIVNLAVGNAAIANAAVTNAKIANLAVDTAQIVDAAIESAKIANLAVGAAAIASLAVGSAKIADAAILEAKIDDLAVTGAKIASLAVGTGHIASAAITEAKIGSLAVTSAKIASLAVTSAKIVDAAIETAKINNLAVTEGKIGSLAVTVAKIANATITGAKIANLAVDTLQIAGNAVTTPHGAYTAGSVTIADGNTNTVQSISITTDGSPLFITCSARTTCGTVNYQLYRGGTEIYDAPNPTSGLVAFNLVDSPSSGTYTYYFKVECNCGGTAYIWNRSMMILGVKK